jgi:hypothetical protein
VKAIKKLPRLLLTFPILDQMHTVEGWLEDSEADLLILGAAYALSNLGKGEILEIGSYCGKSTVVLASVLKTLRPEARVFAVDPHEGTVGSIDHGYVTGVSTLDRFKRNIEAAGLVGHVELIKKFSFDVEWTKPIIFIFIDGLHDYVNVSRDFHHFEEYIILGGLIAFHDYKDYSPGVVKFVDELISSGNFVRFAHVRSLIIIQKVTGTAKGPSRFFPWTRKSRS